MEKTSVGCDIDFTILLSMLKVKSHELSLIKMQHAFTKDILTIFIMYLYILLFSIHMSFWLILVKKYYVCEEAQKRYI